MSLTAPPTTNNSPSVWPLIVENLRSLGTAYQRLADLAEERHAFGRAKYGTPLQVENGRDPLVDALQEALDCMAYTRQHYERVRHDAQAAWLSRANPRGQRPIGHDEDWAWHLHQRSVTFAHDLLKMVKP